MTIPDDKVNLDGIIYNSVPLGDFLKSLEISKKEKETRSVYSDEIKEKSYNKPIHIKPKYMETKERNGKPMNITQEHKNKRITSNFEKCKNFKQVVISVLLSGKRMTARQIFKYIEEETPGNLSLRQLSKKEKINLAKVWNIMTLIKKSKLGITALVSQNDFLEGSSRKVTIYAFNAYGKNLSFEEALKIFKQKIETEKSGSTTKIKKAKIKKAVKEVKHKSIIDRLSETLVHRDDYTSDIQNILNELHEMKEIINSLMINAPQSKMKGVASSLGINLKSDQPNVKVEVSGGVDVNFRFLL